MTDLNCTCTQDPRHTFLTSEDVFERMRWKRTYGYLMLKSAGFPPRVGLAFRLDTIMAWEDRVLAGELPGVPDQADRSGLAEEATLEPVAQLPARRNSRRNRAA